MGIIDTRIFKSGNSMAVRLPKGLGFEEGMAVQIVRNGNSVTVRPAVDPAEEKRKVLEFVEALRAAGPPIVPVEVRDPDIFPDRPGLY